jgi:NADPH-dependent curcumin reductase CurA
LAKLAGNTVIGTCSGLEKIAYLKSLGCDRVIDYTKEDVGAVLAQEFPRGVDLVFESVGGSMLEVYD